MYKKNKVPLCLVILDGFGVAKKSAENAISSAKTPSFDFLKKQYFYTTLLASGTSVGLPRNFVGSSEVGHLTIGAGRIIGQPLTLINKKISSGEFFKHPIFLKIKKYVLGNSHAKVHIIGLLSDAGVHAYIKHFDATLKALVLQGISCIFFHPILDGRDTAPHTGRKYLKTLEKYIKKNGAGKIATLHGRFYAMDRDNNSERTAKTFEILTEKSVFRLRQGFDGQDAKATPDRQRKIISLKEVTKKLETQKTSEEFLEPVQINPAGIIEKGDIVIFLNYREERIVELAEKIKTITPQIYSMVPYEHISKKFFYPHPEIKHSLKEVLSKHKKSMFSIAETEKFAHITYFLSCEYKRPFFGEQQVLISSIKEKTYAKTPNMKAPEITKTVLKELKQNNFDVYFINYANADMVGHSGNFKSTVQAIECLDEQIKKLYEDIVKKRNGILIITGDHGKAEKMLTKKGEIVTSHTKNRVPLLVIIKDDTSKEVKINNMDKKKLKGLKDIAPLILKLLKIKMPKEMKQ